MKNVFIEWKGISPTDETKQRMELILDSLKYVLPQDSDIRLYLERFPKNCEGHIVIRSPLGDFAAQDSHKDMFVLCKNLKKIIKQQVFKYRQTHSGWNRAA